AAAVGSPVAAHAPGRDTHAAGRRAAVRQAGQRGQGDGRRGRERRGPAHLYGVLAARQRGRAEGGDRAGLIRGSARPPRGGVCRPSRFRAWEMAVLPAGGRPVRSSMADFRLPDLPSMLQDKRFLLWLAFGLSWGGVVIALVLQHGFDMQPCAWCTVQRGIYLIVGALALLALIVPGGVASGVVAMLAALGAVGGLVAAGYQQFVA